LNGYFGAKQLAQHSGVAGAYEIRDDVVFDEVEKSGQMTIADAFGLGFTAFG